MLIMAAPKAPTTLTDIVGTSVNTGSSTSRINTKRMNVLNKESPAYAGFSFGSFCKPVAIGVLCPALGEGLPGGVPAVAIRAGGGAVGVG